MEYSKNAGMAEQTLVQWRVSSVTAQVGKGFTKNRNKKYSIRISILQKRACMAARWLVIAVWQLPNR